MPSVKVWQRERNHPTAPNNESYRLKQDTTRVQEQTDAGLRVKHGEHILIYSDCNISNQHN